MFLICGLGNPGNKYNNTRHNIGFKVVDDIIKHFEFEKVKEDKTIKLFSKEINGNKIYILKPLTFMNLSGKPIIKIVNFFKFSKKNIFVIHDDLDLQLSKVKIKKGGSNGGHNGLLSIDQYLGEDYNRIRIGIDHPGHKDLVSDYVLSKFSYEEKEIIDSKIEKIKINFNLIFTDIPLFLSKIAD